MSEDYRVVWVRYPGNEFELECHTAELETWEPEERRWVYLRKATFPWQEIERVNHWRIALALYSEQREADAARSIGAPSMFEAANPAGIQNLSG